MKECTILIPTYNPSEEDIINAFESIEKQTAKDKLIVFIWDDGSTKPLNYKRLADTYMPNVTLQHHSSNENRGVGYARTKCLQMVKTPYFYWLDSDDVLVDPDTLQEHIQFLNSAEGESYDGSCAQMLDREYLPNFYTQGGLWGLCGRTSSFKRYRIYIPSFQYVEDGCFVAAMHAYELKIKTLDVIGYDKRSPHLSAHNAPFWEIDRQFMDYYCLIAADVHELEKLVTDINSVQEIQSKVYARRFMGKILGHLQNFHIYIDTFMDQLTSVCNCTQAEAWYLCQYYLRKTINLVPDSILYQFYLMLDREFLYFHPMVQLATADRLLKKIDIWDPHTSTRIELHDLERIVKQYIGTRWYNDSLTDKNHDYPPQRIKHYPWHYKKLFDN